jgi:outer membrane receptor protein involved in Fe transport
MNSKNILVFSILFILSSLVATGQKAVLSGKVTDGKTGEGLFAATVYVNGSGAVTDFDGAFSFEVDPGSYDVKVSFVGYETFSRPITLAAGERRELSISLEQTVTILNTATVTSGKYEKPLGEVTVSLEVLRPNLIENTNKVSLDDALQKIPGVQVIDGQANIRGGSGFSQGAGSRVLLLQDDIPILQFDSGFPNWDDVPIENIDQIEVVKGAASSLYGSSALNGIINVRTAYAKSEPETKAFAFYNTVFSPKREVLKWWDSAPFSYGAGLSHKQKFDKLDLVLGSYYLKEKSHDQDAFREQGRFNFGLRYRANDRLSFLLNGNFTKGHNNSFFYWVSDTSAYVGAPNTFSENRRFRFNIDPKITYFDKSGNRHRLLGRLYRVDNNISNQRSNESVSYYGEYQFQRQFKGIGLVTTAGVVATGNSVTAELYGDTTFTARNLAAFVQLEQKLFDRLNLSAGFRYEDNLLKNPGFTYQRGEVPPSEERESKPVFRLGANYKIFEYSYLRASWGQGYRYPTIAEKYIFTDVGGFFVFPNPPLQSETGWSAEIGIKQGFKLSSFNGFLDIAVFQMKYQNMIEFNLVRVAGLGFQATNIGDTEIQGLEVSVAGEGKFFGLPTTLLAGYTYIDPRFVEFDNTPARPGEPTTIGQDNANNSSSDDNILKYRSQHIFKLDLESRYKDFSIGLESFRASHIEAIDAIFLLIVNGLGKWRQDNNQGYTVLNVRSSYNFTDHLKLSLILNNSLNAEYSIRPALMEARRPQFDGQGGL